MVREACFYSGLSRIETELDGVNQEAWRPKVVLQYIQDYYLEPDVVVDVTGFWERKVELLKCYSSQFYDPKATGPNTPISGDEFFDFLHGKALSFGRQAGYTIGEGFVSERYIGVSDLSKLL
jgi:LmbE family N-acetylglucosaminyl deacetylase